MPGPILRRLREERGLTMSDVGAAIGRDGTTVSRIEDGTIGAGRHLNGIVDRLKAAAPLTEPERLELAAATLPSVFDAHADSTVPDTVHGTARRVAPSPAITDDNEPVHDGLTEEAPLPALQAAGWTPRTPPMGGGRAA